MFLGSAHDECGHIKVIQNRAVAIKRCITFEAWNYLDWQSLLRPLSSHISSHLATRVKD